MNDMVQFKVALYKHLHAHTLHITSEYLNALNDSQLTFKHRNKSHLPFAGIIRSSPHSTRSQDKG